MKNLMSVRSARCRRLLLCLAAAVFVGQAVAQDMVSGASPDRGNRPKGYLTQAEMPDGVRLLPPPPAPGSTAHALDVELNRRTLELRDTSRWVLAAQDAIPDPGRAFSCAAGLNISRQQSPALFDLLMRSGVDAGTVVSPVKKHYQRKRPFMLNEQPICSGGDPRSVAKDGSYPSGHTAAGWVWALILTSLIPERSDQLLARGHAYGQSRAVCNVHWQSDVIQGRVMASALFARLQANADFRADLESARREIAKISTSADSAPGKCAAETQALRISAVSPE